MSLLNIRLSKRTFLILFWSFVGGIILFCCFAQLEIHWKQFQLFTGGIRAKAEVVSIKKAELASGSYDECIYKYYDRENKQHLGSDIINMRNPVFAGLETGDDVDVIYSINQPGYSEAFKNVEQEFKVNGKLKPKLAFFMDIVGVLFMLAVALLAARLALNWQIKKIFKS